MQRTTGRPRPRVTFGGPPEPPGPPDEAGPWRDDDGHGAEGPPEIVGMAAAQGWVARYERGTLPVLAWVIEEFDCAKHRATHRYCAAVVMAVGSPYGPQLHYMFEGEEERQLGAFIGYYPENSEE